MISPKFLAQHSGLTLIVTGKKYKAQCQNPDCSVLYQFVIPSAKVAEFEASGNIPVTRFLSKEEALRVCNQACASCAEILIKDINEQSKAIQL